MIKRILVAATSLLAACPAVAVEYVSTVDATNPLAYWRLNGANQASTNGLYTTNYSNVTTSAPGTGAPLASDPANTAARFDGVGSDSIINTSLSGSSIAGTGTILAWVNLAMLPSATGRTLSVAGIGQSGNDFDLQFEGDNALRFYTGSGENTTYTPVAGALVGQWHMITATYDGTGGAGTDFRNIYWDGALGASVTGQDVNGAAKANPFAIGYNNVFGNREFSGLIDEVGVWNRALSAGEISTIYASRLDPGRGAGAVPEPATWATMLLGFGLLGAALRRRRGGAVALG